MKLRRKLDSLGKLYTLAKLVGHVRVDLGNVNSISGSTERVCQRNACRCSEIATALDQTPSSYTHGYKNSGPGA